MEETFFAASHTIDPEEKDSVWAARIMYEHYYFGQAKSLLDGKNPQEIREYVAGKQSVTKFKRMFRRAAAKQQDGSDGNSSVGKDLAGIDWEPLALLTQPFNAALAVLQKMPVYVKATAIDPLAREKKGMDYQFLRNRPHLDANLAQFSQMMGAQIDPPSAPNNAAEADISSFDLNPQAEDELNFYMNLFYKLRPESAFEDVLQALAYIYELRKVRDLEDRDQLFYGVSTNRSFFSDVTGLPTVKYTYPGHVFSPDSDLPDFSDQDFRYISTSGTASEIMDMIGSEMTDSQIEEIFDADWALCGMEGRWSILDDQDRTKRSHKVNYCYFEFKSPDALTFHKKKKDNGFYIDEPVEFGFQLRYSSNHPDRNLRGKGKDPTPDEYIKTKWAENTYCGYFFPCWCDDVFKYQKLESSWREPGRESVSPFSINIWKSQDKGSAELCIPLVDQAQKAVYKLQHALIMSKPKGMYVDLKYMRQAVTNLLNTDMKLSMTQMFNLLTDQNIFLGDSEGIDPMELQAGARPYYPLEGGLTSEVEGYLTVINDSITKIQRITGWNDALTGQTPTNDALVGVQKLMLQSSINSLYYAQNAQKNQTEKVFKSWACMVQYILKSKTSASAKTLESILSTYKVDVIRDMGQIPLHQFGIMVENTPTEEQQQELNIMLQESFKADKITSLDFVTLKRIFNYKDAQQLFAIRERKKRERDMALGQQNQQLAMQLKQAEQKNQAGQTQMKVQGGLQEEQIKAEVQKWLAQFGAQAQAALAQLTGQIKLTAQRERTSGQLQKVDKQANVQYQQPMSAVA